MNQIEKSADIRGQWEEYRREFYYAKDIAFEDTIHAVRTCLEPLSTEM